MRIGKVFKVVWELRKWRPKFVQKKKAISIISEFFERGDYHKAIESARNAGIKDRFFFKIALGTIGKEIRVEARRLEILRSNRIGRVRIITTREDAIQEAEEKLANLRRMLDILYAAKEELGIEYWE